MIFGNSKVLFSNFPLEVTKEYIYKFLVNLGRLCKKRKGYCKWGGWQIENALPMWNGGGANEMETLCNRRNGCCRRVLWEGERIDFTLERALGGWCWFGKVFGELLGVF